jgi:two-component system, OmpR family, phosphate regulon sensor histidine kinase PhoR
MILTRKKISWLSLGVLILVTSLLLIQGFWLKTTLRLNEEKFNRKAELLLNETFTNIDKKANEIMLYTATGKEYAGLTISQQDAILRQVKHLIDSSLAENKIKADYEFAIFSCANDYILLSSDSTYQKRLYDESLMAVMKTSPKSNQKGHAYYVGVYFINKTALLLKQLGWPLAVSVILFCMLIATLAYLLLALSRQKKISVIKNDFVNNMTHEFKTPISSIQLATGVLLKGEYSPGKQQDYLQLIDTESRRLESQLNNILQVAMVDAGNFTPDKNACNMHTLIEKVARRTALMVQKTGGVIHLQLNADNPFVNGDETHLANTLYNLLDNAVKYSSSPADISIDTYNRENRLHIRVTDKGIGIDASMQKYIFDKFFRVNNPGQHKTEGFGLGLSYVRSVIDAHKGSITVESKPGEGASFLIDLPVLKLRV